MREKRKVYKKLKDGTGNYEEYKRWKQKAKRAVAKEKESAWKEWHGNLDTKEGEDNIYKIAKASAKQKKDTTHIVAVKAKDGGVIVEEKKARTGGKSTSQSY